MALKSARSILLFRVLVFLVVAFLHAPGFSQVFDWAKQLESDESVNIWAITVDDSDNKYLIGRSNGTISFDALPPITQPNNAFIIKTDPNGVPVWATSFQLEMFPPSVYFFEGIPIQDVEVDGAGNVFLVGTCRDRILIGGDVLINPHYPDYEYSGFVVKLNNQGQYQWARLFAGTQVGDNYCRRLKTDNLGNVVVTGSFKDSIQLDSNTILNGVSGLFNPFIAKYSPTGNLLWAKTVVPTTQPPTINNRHGSDVMIDSDNNVYWHGSANNGGTIDGIPLTGLGGRFVAKLTPAGNHIWHVKINGTGREGNDMDMDSNNRFYGAVEYSNTIHFHGETLSTDPNTDNMLVFCMDSAGALVWTQTLTTPDNAQLHKQVLTVSEDGRVYVLATYNPHYPLRYKNQIVIPKGASYTGHMVASFDSEGNFESADLFPWEVRLWELGADNNRRIYATGYIDNDVVLGQDSLNVGVGSSGNIYISFMTGKNAVRGKTYYDVNANNMQDAGEKNARAVIRVSPFNGYLYSNKFGRFKGDLPWKNINVSVLKAPKYHKAVPDSYSIAFNHPHYVDSSSVFALQPTANVKDLRINITPITATARIGNPYRIQLTCENVGTQPEQATVKFNYHSLFDFQSTFPFADTHTGTELTWESGDHPAL